MKVLYIGSERTEAQAVANALRSVDDNVSVLWAAHLDHAANWLDGSRGLDVLVMEAPIDGASCLAVQKHLRRLALPPAVVFIVPDGIAPTLDSLHPGAHYVRRNDTLSHDLAIVVMRAFESAARTDLEQKLARAVTAREEAETRQKSAADQLTALQTQYEVGMARAAASWDMVDEQLRAAALEVERARQREELAADDVERLTQRELELSSLLTDVRSAHRALERQLAVATEERRGIEAHLEHVLEERRGVEAQLAQSNAAREDAERRHVSATADIARLTTHAAELNDRLADITASRDMLDEQRQTAGLEIERARQREALAAGDIERLTRREQALSSQLAEATATHTDLQRQLADAHAAVQAADARTEVERANAARNLLERQREFDAQVALSTAAREDAERRHASATADIARLTTHTAELNDQLVDISASRDLVDEQRKAATLEVERARQREELAADDVERLTRREQELLSQLAAAISTHTHLQRQLADAHAAVQAADARTELERVNAARNVVERQRDFDAQLVQANNERRGIEAQLEHVLEERRGVEAQLADSIRAREDAEQRHASAMADVDRLTTHAADLKDQLRDVTASRGDLESRLSATQAAFDDATTRATRERFAASKRAAEREAELDGQMQRERSVRATLERTLADVNEALDRARQEHQAATADIESLTTRETDLVSQLADAQIKGETLERQLSQTAIETTDLTQRLQDTTSALDQVRNEFAAAVADVDRLSQREDDLASELARARTTQEALDRELTDATLALREAKACELRLAEKLDLERSMRAAVEQELTQAAVERDVVTQRLQDTDSALSDVRLTLQSATSDVEHLTERETDLRSQLAQISAARDTLERQLADATQTLRDAEAREAELTSRLADREDALDRIRQEYRAASADIERLQDREATLTSQLAGAQAAGAALEHQLSDAAGAIRAAAARETALDDRLTQAQATLVQLEQTIADGQAALADVRAQHETAIDAATSERERLALRLGDTDAALEQVRHDFTAATAEIARLTEREHDLTAQIADAQAIRSTLEQTLSDTRARFVEQRQQLEIQLAQEQFEHESQAAEASERSRELTTERDTLQQSLTALQERARELQDSLTSSVEAFEVSRAESHRLFDHAGVAIFRCTPEGVLTDVNRALTTLLGRRTYELASTDFATAVFEAPQALSWLIERCVSTRTKESIETTWRRQDGSRLFMRLSARSLPSGIVEVVAEDLTRLRVLEERLGQAQRMEALGRLASEVAITCSGLLANIQQQGREWLTSSTGSADSRQRGEQLFEDIGRAAGFLQELAACGDEQARTPMLVDLNTLVRDLEPVLKSVVGGDVEVQLRDNSTPLNVDVNTERVERLLVNLASYGRGRMPAGSRLRIELGTSVVDRHFSAKHPNVRLGLHALITVTESRRAAPDEDPQLQHKRRMAKSGVDFATLQGLVSDCGGHLWMKVHPLGEMVAKIRLPLCSAQEQRASKPLAQRTSRERHATRWFQS
jgi:PAS domain S-box-containing protein